MYFLNVHQPVYISVSKYQNKSRSRWISTILLNLCYHITKITRSIQVYTNEYEPAKQNGAKKGFWVFKGLSNSALSSLRAGWGRCHSSDVHRMWEFSISATDNLYSAVSGAYVCVCVDMRQTRESRVFIYVRPYIEPSSPVTSTLSMS